MEITITNIIFLIITIFVCYLYDDTHDLIFFFSHRNIKIVIIFRSNVDLNAMSSIVELIYKYSFKFLDRNMDKVKRKSALNQSSKKKTKKLRSNLFMC